MVHSRGCAAARSGRGATALGGDEEALIEAPAPVLCSKEGPADLNRWLDGALNDTRTRTHKDAIRPTDERAAQGLP